MRRHVYAIVNPVSGRRGIPARLHRLADILRHFGCRLDVDYTTGAGHATLLAKSRPDSADAVLAVGGDGTLNEVVNGMIGQATPVLAWGTGTKNLVAGELRMPTDAIDVARTLLTGETRACDVGVVNGRRFIANVGVGFDAECVHNLSRRRRGHITQGDYFWPVWRTFWSHRFPLLRVEVDGLCVFQGRGMVVVGNLQRYGWGARLLPLARYDDGLLDVCVVPCSSRLGMLAQLARIAAERHIGAGGVIYCHARGVSIRSPHRVRTQVDGDAAGDLPVTISVEAGAWSVLSPLG